MSSGHSTVAGVTLEAVVVVLAAAAFAFAANQVSPRGLSLARNYFPGGTKQDVAPLRDSRPASVAASAGDTSAANFVDQRLKDKGLQPISRSKVEELSHDARYEQGLIVFVDARNQEEYGAGHIPGAHALDPYHPEKQLGDVLTRCQAADQVVVYCTGGDCEDADTTAILLRDAGVPGQKIFVYGGGYEEWKQSHLPIEPGDAHTAGVNGNAK